MAPISCLCLLKQELIQVIFVLITALIRVITMSHPKLYPGLKPPELRVGNTENLEKFGLRGLQLTFGVISWLLYGSRCSSSSILLRKLNIPEED